MIPALPRLPDVTFRDSLRLDLGGITLELRFCGDAHTDHDLVVYVPGERLLVAGDLICGPRNPCFAVDALEDIPRLARELSRLLQRMEGMATIVPGHGSALTQADLEDFRRSLVAQYAAVRPHASAAWHLRTAMEQEGIDALPSRQARGGWRAGRDGRRLRGRRGCRWPSLARARMPPGLSAAEIPAARAQEEAVAIAAETGFDWRRRRGAWWDRR